MATQDKRKTLIGILSSHDSLPKNQELAELFRDLYNKDSDLLGNFHFVFTGGTFDRIVLGRGTNAYLIPDSHALQLVKTNSTRLPTFGEGGVTVLAHLVVQRVCNIAWVFLSPITNHWVNPENLALMRLLDVWKDEQLMNAGSVTDWFEREAEQDSRRRRQGIPFGIRSGPDPALLLATVRHPRNVEDSYQIDLPPEKDDPEFWANTEGQTIAFIAHDKMKERMVDFAIEYETELAGFDRILTTETTGQEILAATRQLERERKIKKSRSGPKGGDIEIATEVLFGSCHVVVFFIDPLNPHPHPHDILTLLGACIRKRHVRLFRNEEQARAWMDAI